MVRESREEGHRSYRLQVGGSQLRQRLGWRFVP
jgi:hypothetical protein